MTFWRDGVQLFSFKGRLVEDRPAAEELDYSVDQHNQRIIAAATDFVAGSPPLPVRPRKFDVVKITASGDVFTVQRGHVAGADEDELIKMQVRGGMV